MRLNTIHLHVTSVARHLCLVQSIKPLQSTRSSHAGCAITPQRMLKAMNGRMWIDWGNAEPLLCTSASPVVQTRTSLMKEQHSRPVLT
ncbi:hypothetical protein PROFUN_16479 [Planoprotostelium fungivorum]|uniref:Uncharacterized protein n=1 Tax=Planoprotostelium fungivorum TaxID=1890364 RepID=A0A2P6MV58_9EUKA|nr:hypothetical protein PROFUN_16479 [Planoprotostelium fungivorum]